MIRAVGIVVGMLLAFLAARLADVLPRRYGITHLVTGTKRHRRNLAIVVVTFLCTQGISEILARSTTGLAAWHAILLLVVNAAVAAMIVSASAIDLEHMILPNELTLGGALVCLASSPLRAIGLRESAIGAVTGFVVAYVPFWIYKRIRGRSGMGLGDAMFAVLAGAWFGPIGALLVLFGGVLLMPIASVVLRIARVEYRIPESVVAEIAELRAQADAGDEDAKAALADDPMAADVGDGVLATRLPLGPFLALACLILLFTRRFFEDALRAWLLTR